MRSSIIMGYRSSSSRASLDPFRGNALRLATNTSWNSLITLGIHAAGQGGIRIVCNDEVGLPVFQEPCTFNGGLVNDLDMDVWKFLVEAVQIGDQVVAAYGVAGSDAQLPPLSVCASNS